MQTYQSVKDSGVSWLGNVPVDWSIVRPKVIFKERREKSSELDIHLTPSQKYGVLPQQDYMKISGTRVVLNVTGSDNMKHVEQGDFVIHLRSFQGGIEYSSHSGKVSNAYTILQPAKNIYYGFYKYALKSYGFISDLASTTEQLRDGQSIKFSTFDLVKLPLPNVDTQKRIADYLDEETAKIDDLISKQTLLLELLEEKRRATISRAVLRGVYSNVEMKHTGIDWIGDIPSTWGVSRLAQLFIQRNEKVSDKDYSPLSVTKKGIVPQLEDAAKTNDGDNRKKVLKGDFVINSRSDRKGSSGLSELNGSVSLINIVLSQCRLNHRYAHFLLRSYPFQEEFYRWGQGIVADLWSTNYQKMKYIQVPVPDSVTQQAIVNFLEAEIEKIDTLHRKSKSQIKLLIERRSSLISSVVTGKVKV